MLKKAVFILILVLAAQAKAQVSLEQFRLRAGYSLHNSSASRFNKLIDAFNEVRSGSLTEGNLASLNFQHGLTFGAAFEFSEGMEAHLIYKSRSERMSARFYEPDQEYQLVFRQSTLEAGVTFAIAEEKKISHFWGAGIFVGDLGAWQRWNDIPEWAKTRNMTNIDHAGIIGISASYEVRFRVHDLAAVYLRPVAQFALPGKLHKLDAFLNPVYEDGQISYPSTGARSSGSLNGVGIEGGLLLYMPKL